MPHRENASEAVQLLPAQYVRQYVRRNKTDRADAAALIEAARCATIRTVPAKSLEQSTGVGCPSAAQPVDEHAASLPQHPSRAAARVWHRSSPWSEGRAHSHRPLSCTTPAGAARSDPSIAGPNAQRGQRARASHRADRARAHNPHSRRSGCSAAAPDPRHRFA